MSRGMQTDLTSGAYHGRTRRLYVWGLSRSKHKRRNRLDLRATQPPAASAQARPAVGGSLRGDDAPLAAGRQKYRWPPWLGLGCHVVCALGGVDAGEAPQRTRHGVVSGRECRGAGVHWATGRPQAADSGPLQPCPGVHCPRQGRRRGDQCADSQGCPGLWLCRCPYPLVRHHGSGVAHRLSQRTGHFAGCGTALWQSLSEAHKAWGGRGRQGARTGADDPQIGQRTPSLCQEQGRKASGVDTPSDGGRSVDRTNPSHGGATCAEPRSCDPTRHGDAWGHARGSQAAHTADRAVDHHRGGGQGQNRACRFDAGPGDGPQQGRQEGGVWLAVSAQSPWWWVCLWDVDPRGGRRVEDAPAGTCGVPRDIWCAGHTRVGGLRSWRICRGDPTGAGQRGCQRDWHSAQGQGGLARCRGRPRDGQKRARQDRRDHWHTEDGQIWVQQTQRAPLADPRDGRPPVYPLLQSAQVDAGPGTGRQVRRKDIGADRTEKTAPVEREEAGQEAPRYPQRSFATRTKYLTPYAPELNLIEILWRNIKYTWLPFSAYQCLNTLRDALENILKNFGSKYQITFA